MGRINTREAADNMKEIELVINYNGVAIVNFTGARLSRHHMAVPGENVWFDLSIAPNHGIQMLSITGEPSHRDIPLQLTQSHNDGLGYTHHEYKFTMPDETVRIICMGAMLDDIKEESNNINVRRTQAMEPKTPQQGVIATFEIPEDLAKRLSELLTTQTIRERMLNQNIDNLTKYEQMEKMLIPVVSEIEAIKAKITRMYVPQEYRSDAYMWNYDGYEIDGIHVQILNSN